MTGVFLKPTEDGQGWYVQVINGKLTTTRYARKDMALRMARTVAKHASLPLFEEIVL